MFCRILFYIALESKISDCSSYKQCNWNVSGYGISSDGRVIYINASTCDLNYLPTNPPVVFDITLPEGNKK